MNEYLIEILNVVALKSNELSIEIAQIEDELEAFAVSGNLWEDLAQYKKLYSQIIDYYEKMNDLDNEWCNIASQMVAKNNAQKTPIVEIDYSSIESIEYSLAAVEQVLPVFNGGYQLDDFTLLSVDFLNTYRDLLNKDYEITSKKYKGLLSKINEGYLDTIFQKIEKYQMASEPTKYDVGGVIFELKTKEDIEDLYNIIHEFEHEKEQEKQPEIKRAIGTPYSQTSPEIKAKFASIIVGSPMDEVHEKTDLEESLPELEEIDQTLELQSGSKVKLKEFKNKGKKVIKLIGSRFVANGKEMIENLTGSYSRYNENNFVNDYSDINDVTEEPNLSNMNTEPIESVQQTVDNRKETLLSKYGDLIKQKAFENYSGEINNLPSQEVNFIIDSYLDNLIAAGEEKYGDNFVQDIMNEATSEPIKWIMGEVSQSEKMNTISEKTISTIDDMNEYELEDYVNNLKLSSEQLGSFNKLVSDYKMVNPNSDDFTASREALKAMISELDLVKPNIVNNSQMGQASKPENVSPVEVPQSTEAVPQENIMTTIDKMGEFELENYINSLNLTMEEIAKFESYQNQYKKNYAGLSDYAIKKASIKSIVQEREIIQSSNVRTSTVETRSR